MIQFRVPSVSEIVFWTFRPFVKPAISHKKNWISARLMTKAKKKVNNIIVVVDLLSECHFISVLYCCIDWFLKWDFCFVSLIINTVLVRLRDWSVAEANMEAKKNDPNSSHFSLFKLSLILSVCYTMGSQCFWSRISFDTLLQSHDSLEPCQGKRRLSL